MDSVKRYIILLLILLTFSSAGGQVIILTPAEDAVTHLHHVAVTAAGPPGNSTRLLVNGIQVRNGEFRVDGLIDFLNVAVPDGPVNISVESENPDGRMSSMERRFQVLGPVRQIIPEVDQIKLPADGSSWTRIVFIFLDEWGYQLTNLKLATAGIKAGKIIEPDIDPSTGGTQLAIQSGRLEITVESPSRPISTELFVNVNGVECELPVIFTTASEPFILVGGLSTTAYNSANIPDHLLSIDYHSRTTDIGNNYSLNGRGAFYASGNIRPGLKLTTSYDSDRNYTNQFFQEVDPFDQYPIMGDASTIDFDAQSNSPFYARLEHNESYLLTGDFNTAFRGGEFASYDRALNGGFLQLKNRRFSLQGFASRTDRRQAIDEIRGEGISGYYQLSGSNITVYSEKIALQVRDQFQPDVLLKTTPLTRFQDYTIDYRSGSLMFKNAIPSIDGAGNPVYIVARYENQTGSSDIYVAGLHLESNMFDHLKIGSGIIMEEQAPSDYLLYNLDLQLPINRWLAFNTELAYSRTPEAGGTSRSGTAGKLELGIKSDSTRQFKGYYRSVDKNFVNQSRTRKSVESESEKYGMTGNYILKNGARVGGEIYLQDITDLAGCNLRHRFFNSYYRNQIGKKIYWRIDYEDNQRSVLEFGDSSRMDLENRAFRGRMNYVLSEKLAANIERHQNIDSDTRIRPSYSSAGLKYSLGKRLDITGSWKKMDAGGNLTIVGLDSRIGKDTELQAKYEMDGSINSRRNRALVGLNNRWQINQHLLLNLALENTASIDSFAVPTTEHSAATISFDYVPDSPWKASGKYEYYYSRSTIRQVIGGGTSFKINHSLSGLARFEQGREQFLADNSGFHIRGNYIAGAAFRPDFSDDLNLIARIDYRQDENTHINPVRCYNRLVTAAHAHWQPENWLAISGRLAARILVDQEGDYYDDKILTGLYNLRTEFILNKYLSIAIDLRSIDLKSAGERKFGSATDINYLVYKNVQIGIGYIFTEFEDADFSYTEYSINNFYIALHTKFSERLFDWK